MSAEEISILHWIGRGKTNEEIAVILGSAAVGAVKKRLEHIYQLLGVENRVAAAGYARDLLPLPTDH